MDVEREHRRTYQPPGVRRVSNGLDPRGRGLGLWAFVLNRITGIGLVVYLLLHLVVLSLLAQGQASWDAFLVLARSPLFLVLDIILFAAVLIHGLNGIRVVVTGLGFGLNQHKPAFAGLMLVAAVALIYAGYRIFTG